MAKPYLNNMIIGNSGMLGCLDGKGELVRLFWPDIDYPQHIGRLAIGVNCPQLRRETMWFHSEEWRTGQYYIEDTNIAVTVYRNDGSGLTITQSDFVHPDKAVLIRRYEVENTGGCSLEIGFAAYSAAMSTNLHPAGTIYDQDLSALIHYKHNYYYSICSGSALAGGEPRGSAFSGSTLAGNASQESASSGSTLAGSVSQGNASSGKALSRDEVLEYQLGGDAEHNAGLGMLRGTDTIGMMNDGALLWEKRTLAAGERGLFALHICMAQNSKTLKALIKNANLMESGAVMQQTADYWRNYLSGLKRVNTGNQAVDALYRRSLLVFALMTNKRTGALLAAPEVDEEFTRCGRYAYCWGRDAAFIAAALDSCGLHADVGNFYRWAASVQEENGSWQQRYHMDGNLAPSWGLQIDEGGSILLGILKHYEATGEKAFLAEMWPSVKKGAEFLSGHIDPETELPWLSFDLWEERLGEHAYSTAAVCAGMEAGARIAGILAEEAEAAGRASAGIEEPSGASQLVHGAEADAADTAKPAGSAMSADATKPADATKLTDTAKPADTTMPAGATKLTDTTHPADTTIPAEAAVLINRVLPADRTEPATAGETAEELRRLAGKWHAAASGMRAALERNFWHSGWNRFVRSVRVKMNAWGDEPTDAKIWLKMTEKSISRDFSLLDGTVDISLLGPCIPFGLYPAGDPRMESTAQTVEQVLAGRQAGGLMRYEYDSYIGGNPWIIATLWAALYHIEKKSYSRAREYFYWAVKGTTEQGLLPEQVDRDTGRPSWVIPLTWSHAMFILVLDALVSAGEL